MARKDVLYLAPPPVPPCATWSFTQVGLRALYLAHHAIASSRTTLASALALALPTPDFDITRGFRQLGIVQTGRYWAVGVSCATAEPGTRRQSNPAAPN